MDSREFALYMAYDRIDPFSNERFDLGVGIICNTLAALQGNKTKISDFMPEYEKREVKKVSPKQSFAMFAAHFKSEKVK